MADELRKVCEVVRVKSKEIVNELTTKDESNGRPIRASDIVEATMFGVAVFPLSVGYLHYAVCRPLRLTSNKRVVAPVAGSLSVAVSGSVASLVFVYYVNLSRNVKTRAFEFYKDKFDSYFPLMQYNFKKADILVYCVGSLAVFKVFGGRFRSVLPSSLIHPGSFARVSLPANSQAYASDIAKEKLNKLGRKYGCHSCGKKRWTSFVGDHIPPNKLVRPKEKQRFFPQCRNCSSRQGAALSSNIKSKLIKTHATTLRLYHLWLPVPAGVMWLKSQYIKADQ